MSTQIKITYGQDDGFKFDGDKEFCLSKPEPNESSWRCPVSLGVGDFLKIRIRKGFEVWLSDCAFNQEIVFTQQKSSPLIQFIFVLSGHFHGLYGGSNVPVECCGEHQGIACFNGYDSSCRIMNDVPVRCVSIVFHRDFFYTYFEDTMGLIPPIIHKLLTHETDNGYQYKSHITAVMREITQQIVNCPYHGIARQFFIESRALELLSHQFSQATESRSLCSACPKLHPQDRKQTEFARDFLITNIETPPCLEVLAKSAGMSHPKLNRCFKQLYGMTVFQYLRTERLNQAKVMLEKQGYSVTEAAYQVGYESLSHFSQAYKKRFGASPSTSLKVA